MMKLEIQDANPADAPELTQLFYASFGGEFNRTMFPEVPDVISWWEDKFAVDARNTMAMDGHEVLLKVVDGDADGAIAAFAKWKQPVLPGDGDRQEHERVVWAPSSDKSLCEHFFSAMNETHENCMGERPHYYLDMLGVHPSYQGRGIASMLLNWGLTRADAEGVETFLSASPEGIPVYEKRGFQSVGKFSPFAGWVQESMIRSPKRQASD